MTIQEKKDLLRSQLTGDFNKDKDFLAVKSEEYLRANDREGMLITTDLLIEIMPEQYQKEAIRLMYLDGKRIDKVHQEIIELINRKDYITARPLAEQIYDKITEGFKESDDTKFVSLRNPFEENLYQILFKPSKTLHKAPFDFSSIISSYGYILVEFNEYEKAEEVLKVASAYNPVDCGPKFELAECYKIQNKSKELIELTKETIAIASSPIAISRCYTNLGYMCVSEKNYDDAIAFYYASLLLAPHPTVKFELQNISIQKGEKIIAPTTEQTLKVFEKYNIPYGPNKDVISVAALCSQEMLRRNDIKNGVYYLKILYSLTNDNAIKDIILKYEPETDKKEKEDKTEK